ncbi:hypothetical protein [Streptomyces sioyaensis]|uniref:hypothetical protein n=1 Tax=Streptomyces sioyaensis TaxID=67364 RepID=UPI0037235A45
MLAVRVLLVLAVRIGGVLRTRCTAGGGPVRTLVGVLPQHGEPVPSATELTELVGAQLQGLQVRAQDREVDRRVGVGRGPLLGEEEQLLGPRGRLVRGRARGGRYSAGCAARRSGRWQR